MPATATPSNNAPTTAEFSTGWQIAGDLSVLSRFLAGVVFRLAVAQTQMAKFLIWTFFRISVKRLLKLTAENLVLMIQCFQTCPILSISNTKWFKR